MTETTEKAPRTLSKPVKIIGTAILTAAAAFSSIGLENKTKTPTITPQETGQDQGTTPDKILSPQETNVRIQEFIAKIDSAFDGVKITPPAEFPNTFVIRNSDPARLSDKKMPSEFTTAIANEDYLTAEGVKRMAQNCNATQEPIIVRNVEYTKLDDFYINHLMEYCEGVGYALRYAFEQTNNPLTKSMLKDWHKIHLGIYETIRITEPPLDPTSYYDLIDKDIYQIPQK